MSPSPAKTRSSNFSILSNETLDSVPAGAATTRRRRTGTPSTSSLRSPVLGGKGGYSARSSLRFFSFGGAGWRLSKAKNRLAKAQMSNNTTRAPNPSKPHHAYSAASGINSFNHWGGLFRNSIVFSQADSRRD